MAVLLPLLPPPPTLFRPACLTCVLWSISTQAWPAEYPSLALGAAQQPSAVSTAPRAFVPPGPAAVRPPRPPSSVARVPRCCGFRTLRAPGCSCSFCVIGRLETVSCVPGEDQGSISFQSVGPAGVEVGRSSLGWGPREGPCPPPVPTSCVPLTLGTNPALERLLRKDLYAGERGAEALGLQAPQCLPWPPQACASGCRGTSAHFRWARRAEDSGGQC